MYQASTIWVRNDKISLELYKIFLQNNNYSNISIPLHLATYKITEQTDSNPPV
jgi:hypothetical protein